MDIVVKYINKIYHVVKIFENGKCVGIEDDGTIKIFDIAMAKAVNNSSLVSTYWDFNI